MRIIEPFAGLGAYGLRALWQAAGSDGRMRWEPPVSRVGSKSGFCLNMFRAFGLQRADWTEILWNDMDAVCHLFHILYCSAELRDMVSRKIWSYVPCVLCNPSEVEHASVGLLKPTPDTLTGTAGCPVCSGTGVYNARLLWQQIRKDPVPGDVVGACAAGMWLQGRSFCHASAEIRDGNWKTAGQMVPAADGSRVAVVQHTLASRLESLPAGLATLADVTAKALFLQSRSFQLKPVSIVGGAWDASNHKPEHYEQKPGARGNPQGDDSPRWTVAERVEALPGRWVEEGFSPDVSSNGVKVWSAQVGREGLASRLALFSGPGNCRIGVSRMDALEMIKCLTMTSDDVLVVDGPYKDTTGYAHDSSRQDILEICDRGKQAGALVICHESVGLAKELGQGWYERNAGELRNRSSTFHKDGVEREWITTSRPPVYWPARQQGLFST